MNTRSLLLAVSLAGSQAFAQTPPVEPPKPPEPAATPAPRRTLLKYTPPKNAVAGARLDGDGGSRGTADKDKLPSLTVLTPSHAGLTTSPQPTLFWYQTAGSATRLELTVVEPKNPEPVLRAYADGSTKPGIHCLPLARYGAVLKPGVKYTWTVAWVPDGANRSLSVVARGGLECVAAETKMVEAVAAAKGAERAAVYAQNGIWYDALDAITLAIDSNPENKELRGMRADLLEQAGLKTVAAAERK
jgi:hypothetical protein